MSNHTDYCLRGFTLVEMAVVLVIFGLLLGGLLVPLTAQIDLRNYKETKKSMDEIQQALIGYAMTHGYLPCPAKSYIDGSENRDLSGQCSVVRGNVSVGFLPWAELGLPRLDSWGHLYRYSVTLAYANSITKIKLSPYTPRYIVIKSRDATGTAFNLTTGDNESPAVIICMGKNGALAFNEDGNQMGNSSVTNDDEIDNANNTTTFYSRALSENASATGGEFDDVVAWISPGLYASKMVEAGWLP